MWQIQLPTSSIYGCKMRISSNALLAVFASISFCTSCYAGFLSAVGIQREVSGPGAITFANGIAQAIPFNSTNIASTGFSTNTGSLATVSDAGLYRVGGSLTVRNVGGVSPASALNAYIIVNGAVKSFQTYSLPTNVTPNVGYETIDVETLTTLNPGDNVSISLEPVNGNGVELITSSGVSRANISRIVGGESYIVGGVDSGNAVIAPNTIYDIPFITRSSSGITTSNGNFAIAPVSGMYSIESSLAVQSTNVSPGAIEAQVLVNGSVVSANQYTFNGSQFNGASMRSSIYLNAGDTVNISVVPINGSDLRFADNVSSAHMTFSPEAIGIVREIATTNISGTSLVQLSSVQLNIGGFGSSSSAIGIVNDSGLYDISGSLSVLRLSGLGDVSLSVLVDGNVRSTFLYYVPGIFRFDTLSFQSLLSLTAGQSVQLEFSALQGGQFQLAGGSFSRVSLVSSITSVPEPSSLMLATFVAMLGVGRFARRQRSPEIDSEGSKS